ncbi:hypothetical protein OAG02_00875 [bacterium]|nr:hypothetical protein [Akkermansiaceae bacterium]MDB4392255.1 hypothetical protein [bacterium]MDA7615742.1 hypothetical protein [Akkermansiaceae bacterium]MDA7617646.1 hypothetical protein [Akkermansiaceae bacterium]MDA7623809.1 hypothetical protein [Akkermansiaceae bacterium]
MKEPWSIKSRARECVESGDAFQSGQKIRAAIFPDPESSGYLRKDYTIEAWENREGEENPFSCWLTTYEPPVTEEKTEDVVDDDPETLLKRLVDEEEEHTENARYILAVMLERKKLLRETDTQEIPSGILRIYEHRKSGDVYIIKDPQISLTDVDRVQEEVRQLLDPSATVAEETTKKIEPTDGNSPENLTNLQPSSKDEEEKESLETKNNDKVE